MLETAIAGPGHGDLDQEEIIWGLVDAVAAAIDGGSAGGGITGGMHVVYDMIRHKDAKAISTTPISPLYLERTRR
ncbi:MAG: hypothetical protein P8164_13890 [Gammaproteobacteria bacterium]|jgi:hypothetical protein